MITKEDTTDNDALIEEMLRDAAEAPEPGTTTKVIHRGDEKQPAPMTLAELSSAGWAYIYETSDGQRSVANRNMLKELLKVRNKDGTPRFTTRKPNYEPKRGTLKCLLHEDDPNRAHYSDIGFTICRKSNLTSPYMVTQHMRKRHPVEWQTIEKERTDSEKAEDREAQHAMLRAIKGEKPTEGAPLYVSKKDKKK